MSTPIYKRRKRSFTNNILWQSLNYYPLTQVVRQSDVAFSSIRTKIGNGEALSPEETTVIESRFVTQDDINQRLPNAIRLFLKNVDVAKYNSDVLSKYDSTVECVATDCYTGYKDQAQLTSMKTKVHKMKTTETAGLPYVVRFLPGLPYMITANIDIPDGLVNGTIGILKRVEFNEEGIKRVWLKFDNTKTGRLARTKCKFSGVLETEDSSTWVPITRRSSHISFRTRTLTCKRFQFPLLEASALTIHKSEGGTYEYVVYDYHKSHDQQLVYVALSRATTLEGLYLTNKDGDFKFHHARGRVNIELKNEFQRLENHRLHTITQECSDFLNQTEIKDLSLVSSNVQSLKSHFEDVVSDSILTKAKILALTETWVNNKDSKEIPGYLCVSQSMRENLRSGGVAMYERLKSSLSLIPHRLLLADVRRFEILRENVVKEPCGDICAVDCNINDRRVLMVTVYISPNANMNQIKFLMLTNLLMYTPKASEMFEEIRNAGLGEIPIVLSGDINVDILKKPRLPYIHGRSLRIKVNQRGTNNTWRNIIRSRLCEKFGWNSM